MELSVKLVQEAQTGTSVPFRSYCLTAIVSPRVVNSLFGFSRYNIQSYRDILSRNKEKLLVTLQDRLKQFSLISVYHLLDPARFLE